MDLNGNERLLHDVDFISGYPHLARYRYLSLICVESHREMMSTNSTKRRNKRSIQTIFQQAWQTWKPERIESLLLEYKKSEGLGYRALYALKQRCLCVFCLAANLSCLCHPVRLVHQHLPCDVLWTNRNLKPKEEMHAHRGIRWSFARFKTFVRLNGQRGEENTQHVS